MTRRLSRSVRDLPLPRVGPCYDPLRLWFLEFRGGDGCVYRRYYADRTEARGALRRYRAHGERSFSEGRLS